MCGGGGGGCGSILGTIGTVLGFLPGPLGMIGTALSVGSQLLGGSSKSPSITIPTPAAPAPAPRAGTGPAVSLGADNAASRVSGARSPFAPPPASSSDNVLSGLGRGGLAI